MTIHTRSYCNSIILINIIGRIRKMIVMMIQQLMLQPGLYHFGSLDEITASYNQSVCEFFGRTTTIPEVDAERMMGSCTIYIYIVSIQWLRVFVCVRVFGGLICGWIHNNNNNKTSTTFRKLKREKWLIWKRVNSSFHDIQENG